MYDRGRRLSASGHDHRDACRMVHRQLQSRGITDRRVITAMRRIPRHRFAAFVARSGCYGDHPVPIGFGQTMSQPFMVGLMTELLALTGRERVLEVGTGSGYQTAILAELAGHVWSVEIIPALQHRARRVLADLGFSNVDFRTGDGGLGWLEAAPFDRILVAAASPSVPQPLVEQLADGGVMLIPIGKMDGYQVMTTIRRCGSSTQTTRGVDCRFVPLCMQSAAAVAPGREPA
jgi:protein-L-isoaspartate(D-aspartate) O-methyltransferase